MLKKSGLSHSCKAVAAGSALLLGLGLASQAQAGPRLEFGDDGGFLQIDLKGQIYLENTSYGGGIKGDESRTDIHFMRNRISLTGMLDETWGYKFQTCGNTGTTKNTLGYALSDQDTNWNDRDIRVIDAYAIANFNPALNLKVGLTKIPLTRANLDDCFAPLSQDRSMFVYSAYGTSPAKFARDLGGVATGRFFDDKLTYFAGIFQGREGSSTVVNPLGGTNPDGTPRPAGATYTSSNAPKTMLEYVGRLTYDFMDSEGGSGYQGTYFGEKNVLNIGVGMAYQPKAAYKYGAATAVNPSNNVYGATLQNGNADTVDYTAYAVDFMYEQKLPAGVITATGQYLKVDFENAWQTNTNPGDHLAVVAGMNGQKEGGYGKLAYILPLTIGKAGKLQPYAMYEYWEFARVLGVNHQIINQPGGGINYYVLGDNRVRLTVEYLRTDFNTPTQLPVGGTTVVQGVKGYDTFRTMLQLVF